MVFPYMNMQWWEDCDCEHSSLNHCCHRGPKQNKSASFRKGQVAPRCDSDWIYSCLGKTYSGTTFCLGQKNRTSHLSNFGILLCSTCPTLGFCCVPFVQLWDFTVFHLSNFVFPLKHFELRQVSLKRVSILILFCEEKDNTIEGSRDMKISIITNNYKQFVNIYKYVLHKMHCC